jgi:hypothetical protein
MILREAARVLGLRNLQPLVEHDLAQSFIGRLRQVHLHPPW